MKKVAIITNIPNPYRTPFFRYLQDNFPDYEIHIIYSKKGSFDRQWDVSGYDFKNSHFLSNKTLLKKGDIDTRSIVFTYGLSKILRKIKPDIIVGSEYNFTAQCALSYAKRHKIPYVSWSDGTLTSERSISSLQRRLRRRVVKNSAAFIASSTKTRELQMLYGAPEDKIFVSLLTVDTSLFTQKKESYGNHLLYVGSSVKRKGLDLLLSALPKVKSDYHLDIIGCDTLDDDCMKLAEDNNILEKITFHGFVQTENIKEYYKKGDIFILPTREDCFALVILEAMCSSLPILVSKYADGAYDLLKEGENGYLFDPYNADKLADKIDRLLNNPELCRSMGERSYEISQSLGIAPSAKSFIRAIDYTANLSVKG